MAGDNFLAIDARRALLTLRSTLANGIHTPHSKAELQVGGADNAPGNPAFVAMVDGGVGGLVPVVIDNAGLSGDTELVSAAAGQTTRVHLLRINVAGATVVSLMDGASLLERFNFAGLGGGIVLDFSVHPHYVTSVNSALVLNSSAAVQVDGRLERVRSA